MRNSADDRTIVSIELREYRGNFVNSLADVATSMLLEQRLLVDVLPEHPVENGKKRRKSMTKKVPHAGQ